MIIKQPNTIQLFEKMSNNVHQIDFDTSHSKGHFGILLSPVILIGPAVGHKTLKQKTMVQIPLKAVSYLTTCQNFPNVQHPMAND